MEKSRRCIKFDKNYLNSLKKDGRACVEMIKSTRHLSLHPFHLSDVNNSVKEILTEQIAKYDKKSNGILLSFQNIKLLRSIGSISFDSSFTHIDIEVELFVFKPEVGKVLRGFVNKKSKDHVGCLVHRYFNVSLPRPADCENWLGSTIQIGYEIEFRITFTNLEARLPYIKGEIISLLSEDSGISTGEEGNNHAVNTITKFNVDESAGDDADDDDDGDDADDDDDDDGDDDDDAATLISRKKSQKRKFTERTSDQNDEEIENSHRKHKKRKRRNSVNETDSYTLTGLLNCIEEKEASEGKKAKNSDEKENYDYDGKKKKKSRKGNHDADVSQRDKHILAVSEEIVSKNMKLKRKLNTPDENPSTIKRKKMASEVQEIDLEQEGSALPTKSKHENAPNIGEIKKGKRKRKSNADETFLEFNLSEIFNETLTDRKPKSKKEHKVVENTNKKELGNLESRSARKKTSASFSELNPINSSVQKPGGANKKSKKKKSSDIDLLALNFDDIINESVVKKKNSHLKHNHTSEKVHLNPSKSVINLHEEKRSKSQPRDVEASAIEMNRSISKSEKRRSKSVARDVETKLARQLFPPQETKSKKKKKGDSDLSLSLINFEDIINESTAKMKDAKSKVGRKKRPKKSKDQEADVSLPELNLEQLFGEGVNMKHSRTSVHGNTSWQNKTFELPPDSDMENILSSCIPKSSQKSRKKT